MKLVLVKPQRGNSAPKRETSREYQQLLATSVAKYRPADDHELAVVREIAQLLHANTQARQAIQENSRPTEPYRKEYDANLRAIVILEQRLRFLQREWPAQK